MLLPRLFLGRSKYLGCRTERPVIVALRPCLFAQRGGSRSGHGGREQVAGRVRYRPYEAVGVFNLVARTERVRSPGRLVRVGLGGGVALAAVGDGKEKPCSNPAVEDELGIGIHAYARGQF